MPDGDAWLDANRRNWNDRTPIHRRSRSYDVEGFIRAPRQPWPWEAEYLGPLGGLDVAHLQCHIGLDTIALARAGASVVGLESHPLAFSLHDHEPTVVRSYFEEEQPVRFDDDKTYAHDDPTERIINTESYQWNHSLGEIASALSRAGLSIQQLAEHDWTCWPRFSWLTPAGDGRWVPDGTQPRLPLSFTLVAG